MIDLSAYKKELNGKAIYVVGLARSGIATIEACRNSELRTFIWDDSKEQTAKVKLDRNISIMDPDNDNWDAVGIVILAPGIPLTHPEPHRIVELARANNIEIICDIELFHRVKPYAKTIGITGTNGKSTTTALTNHVLNDLGIKSYMGGNIGNAILSLPDENDATYIIEMSSYQLDLCPSFKPDISVILNISPDHLDRHGGMVGYIKAKEKIISNNLIIGIDNLICQEIYEEHNSAIPVSYSKDIDNGIYIDKKGVLHDNVKKCKLILYNLERLKGQHNQQNAAICYVIASHFYSQDGNNIHASMQSFEGLEHRQQLVKKIDNITFINDSKATNAEAASKAIKTYNDIYLILGGLEKEDGLNDIEPYLDHIKHCFLIGDATNSFAKWLDDQEVENTKSETMENAISQSYNMAKNDNEDVVILLSPACASFDQYPSFEKRGDDFINLVEELDG